MIHHINWRIFSIQFQLQYQRETVSGLSATTTTVQKLVINQSPTSSEPLCDHQKTFHDRFGCREVSTAASTPYCSQIALVTSLQPLQLVCDWRLVSDIFVTPLHPHPPETTQNNGCKEYANTLHAISDRGFTIHISIWIAISSPSESHDYSRKLSAMAYKYVLVNL